MGIMSFNIVFDQNVYYPEQIISGKVFIILDKPKEIRAVELKISGKAECKWSSDESYTDSEGKSQNRSINHYGKQKYISTKLNLTPGYTSFLLPAGSHEYPFSVPLPSNCPSTYKGTYGSISYCGKAKLDIPMAFDKSDKKYFTVKNILNLNYKPELKNPYKGENTKTFCCWCCASGPLFIVAYLPRTGFLQTEEIPIIIEVDNASKVNVNHVKAKLIQNISWYAADDAKHETFKLKILDFGALEQNNSVNWSKSLPLYPETYPNTDHCDIIKIEYVLKIDADASGPHSDLEINIPIFIGDIGYDETVPINTMPPQPGFNPGLSIEPVPGPVGPGFAHLHQQYPPPLINPNPSAAYPPYPNNGGISAPYSANPTTTFPSAPSYGPTEDISYPAAPSILNSQPHLGESGQPSGTPMLTYPQQPPTAP